MYAVALDGDDVVAEAKRKTPRNGGVDGVIDAVTAVVADLDVDAAAVGVGAPGPVEPSTGTVRQAPNLPGWSEPVPLADVLAQRLGVTVTVDNDVNCATLAEQRLGAAAGAGDVLGVWVGTGVGAGLVLDGVLRRGPHGGAGELGHVVVNVDGHLCGCGHRGHLEAYAGRAGMEREARRRHQVGEPTLLVESAGDKRMTSRVWAEAIEAGDTVATEIMTTATGVLGAALATVMALVEVEVVVIGGGLADRFGEPYLHDIDAAFRRRLFGESPVELRRARLGDRSGAIGAALLAG